MCRALWGDFAPAQLRCHHPEAVSTTPGAPISKRKVTKAFAPRLRVTLRVGKEFEGKTFELIHDADTLSKLLAEQETTNAAR
ncbi:hypothetical protein ACW9I8_19975 [Pseudomonas reactans]